MRAGRKSHLFSSVSMDCVEPLAATLEQNADQIDQNLSIARGRFHRRHVAADASIKLDRHFAVEGQAHILEHLAIVQFDHKHVLRF